MDWYFNPYALVLFLCALATIWVAVYAWRQRALVGASPALALHRLFDIAPVARDKVIENMIDGVLVLDTQGRIVDANPAMLQLIGRSAGKVVGRPVAQVLAGQPDLVERYRDMPEVQTQITMGEGEAQRCFDLRISPLYGRQKTLTGRVVVLRDITERKQAEGALRVNEQRFRELYASTRRQAQEMALRDQVRMAVAHELDLPAVIRNVVDGIAETFGYPLVSLYMRRGDVMILQHQVGYDEVINEIPITKGVLGNVVRTGQPTLLKDAHADPDFLEAAKGITSEVCVPLFDRAQVVGALNIESSQGMELTEADLRLLTALSESISIAIGRARLYAEIRESEERHRLLVELSPDGIMIHVDGKIAFANQSCATLFGASRPEELYGKPFLDIIHPDSLGVVQERLRQMLVQGEQVPLIEEKLVRLDGSIINVEVTASPFAFQGKPAVQVIMRDVTERMWAEEALRESEEKHRILLDESSDPIFAFYPDGQYRYVNKAFADGVGKKREEIMGKKIWDVFPKDEADKRYAAVKWVFENGETKVIEVRVPRSDGDRYYITTVKPILNDQGKVISVMCISKEITERKRAEEAERAQRVLAEALRDTAVALNSTLDLGKVLDRILANVGRVVPHDAASIMLIDAEQGVARISRSHGYIERGVDVGAWRFPVADFVGLRTMAETGQSTIVSDTRADPGWVRRLETDWQRSYIGAPIRVKGQIFGFMNLDSTTPGFFTPIHADRLQTFADQAALAIENAHLYDQAHRHARELEQQAMELQARNEELDAFAHTVAHDLKNPVSLVTASADLLADEQFAMDEQERMQCASTISHAGRKMDNIIQELLLLSQLRTVDVEKEPLDMAAIVEEARRQLAQMSTEYQAEITLPAAPVWPVTLGYGPWIEEVWVNYLSNAIKYGGKPPRVELGVETLPDGMVRFWVRDNGPGIPPKAQARLFTPFTRLDQVRARGHGLGLSIVRRIVEKLGGQAGVESAVGRGSLFYFTLPAAPSPAASHLD